MRELITISLTTGFLVGIVVYFVRRAIKTPANACACESCGVKDKSSCCGNMPERK